MKNSIWLILAAAGFYFFSKARAAYNLEYSLTGIKLSGGILNPVVQLTALIYNGTPIGVTVDNIEGEILANGNPIATANVLGSLNIPGNGFQSATMILSNIKISNIAMSNLSSITFEGFATVGGGRVRIPLIKKLR